MALAYSNQCRRRTLRLFLREELTLAAYFMAATLTRPGQRPERGRARHGCRALLCTHIAKTETLNPPHGKTQHRTSCAYCIRCIPIATVKQL